MDQGARPVIGADNEGRRPVRVDVIRACLRIVLDDEYGGVFPIRAGRHLLDQAAQRVIIISHIELRGRLTRPHSGRVIVWKPKHAEIGHRVRSA